MLRVDLLSARTVQAVSTRRHLRVPSTVLLAGEGVSQSLGPSAAAAMDMPTFHQPSSETPGAGLVVLAVPPTAPSLLHSSQRAHFVSPPRPKACDSLLSSYPMTTGTPHAPPHPHSYAGYGRLDPGYVTEDSASGPDGSASE